MKSRVTPAQTIGPFFHGLLGATENAGGAAGPGTLALRGRVLDGAGAPVSDALLELWQTDGREWRFARAASDAAGEYRFATRKLAGAPLYDGRPQAPHADLSVFARGLLHRLVTRVYFPDEAEANARDPLLASIADPALRARLVARADGEGALRFDVVLQGELETPFLDV
ncbi:MAG TPA: protocatechuate 3,4-dioxygenase subunit alpha [Myxococcota bacterium]|nr:protocatechuate 3,4-dioxygenase subunit alpha [Myxococcota bacterium]